MKTTPSPIIEKPFWLRFEYQLRRVGFVFLLAIVVAALVGIFSRGYLSQAHRSNDAGSLTLDYERFNRLTSNADLKINSIPTPGKPNRIILGGDFMEAFRIDNLQPQPANMYSQNGKVIIEYNALAGREKQTLWLSLTPMKIGVMKSTVALDNGADISFQQLVYP